MDVGMIVQWKLVVSASEFRLIQRALRGVIETDTEKADAMALQEKMMRVRAKEASQLADEANKVIKNIEGDSP